MKKVSGLAVVLMFSQIAAADYLGLGNGRGAVIDQMAPMSIEAGYTTEGDISTVGARLNFKVSPDLLVFGDIGNTGYDFFGFDVSGLSFGAGAFYQLKNIELLEGSSVAVKGSYHISSLEIDNCSACGELDLSELTVEALVSGDASTDLTWYFNSGIHLLGADAGGGFDDNSTELSFGGGVVGSFSLGEWYAGADFIDELFIRVGARYNIR